MYTFEAEKAPPRVPAPLQAKRPNVPYGPTEAHRQVLDLQRRAGNQAVTIGLQRLVDGFFQDGTKVVKSRISLGAKFKEKHVAADEDAVKTVTKKRIDSGTPAAMARGTLGNTVAKEADWITAIDDSTAVIPDVSSWTGGLPLKVTGWEGKAAGATVAVTALADAARTVGGTMKKKGGGVLIDHVSGQHV